MIVQVDNIEVATKTIAEFDGPAKEFQLLVPDSMNDAAGVNIAIILDAILAKGWMPEGFIQGEGHRIYEYSDG
jgi:hypothetical protein